MRWLAAIVVGIIILCIVLTRGTNEGFQTYKELNVPYTKEVYSVGLTANAYTYEQAVAKCKEFGGDLATQAQLTTAQRLGAVWGIAGWVKDSRTTVFAPQASGVQSRAPTGEKAAANCYGTKPETGTFGVQWFSDYAPSIVDTDPIAKTMTGDGKLADGTPDLFVQAISPSQALYALEQVGPDWRAARKFIADNWETINTTIRNLVEPETLENEQLAAWANGRQKSCELLNGIQTRMAEQHTALKTLYRTIQRMTSATIGAKMESMDFQREIAWFCRTQTAASSPACRRLAELDFDVLYKDVTVNAAGTVTGTNLFKSLDNLNSMLAARECELQTGITAVQRVMDALQCGAAGYEFKAEILGNFRSADGRYYTCDRVELTAEYLAQFPNRMEVQTSIGYIPSEDLRIALEEISPFFNGPGYAELFNAILNQLSVLLRIPEFNDYSTAMQNLATIPSRTSSVGAAMSGLWSPS